MSNVEYTHQKRPYRATAIQWDGSTQRAITQMVSPAGVEVEAQYRNEGRDMYLVLRHRDHDGRLLRMETLRMGDWVRRGENGMVKTYSAEEFDLKYIPLVHSHA